MISSDPLNLYTTDNHLRPVDIRKDLDKIADLIQICFSQTMDEDGKAYLRQLRKSAEDARRLGWAASLVEENQIPITGYVWEENDQIIGNLTLIPLKKHEEQIHLVANVAVLPPFRRKGIGEKLTQAAISYVQKKNCGSIWLQVRDDNPAAELLYRNLGFLERARRTTLHNFSGDPIPSPTPGYDITGTSMADWNKQERMLENIYPATVVWNLPVNIPKFKPTLISQFSKVFTGETHKSWALRRNGELLGTLTWETARTWADNLWVGTGKDYQETVLSNLLPHAMGSLRRTQPQAINYPTGEAEAVFARYGFKKHLTLIWMELPGIKQGHSTLLASG